MEMVDVLELLEQRRKAQGLSYEDFATQIAGISGNTYWRYKSRNSDISNDIRQRMIAHYIILGDATMVGALVAYKTGACFSDAQAETLGKQFLKLWYPPALALAN